MSSHEEISRLSQLVGSAAVVGGPGGPGAGGPGAVGGAQPPVSMNVPLGGQPGKVGANAGGRGGGYGY